LGPAPMTVDPAAMPLPTPAPRRRWLAWTATLALAGVPVLLILVPGLRGLAADTWREMRGISPVALVLIFGLRLLQALWSAIVWRNALSAAWPQTPLPYRFVLGVEQGQVAVNTVIPARAGTWAMLGVFRAMIPGARVPTLLAVWAAQSLAFGLFAGITYGLIAVGPPGRTQTEDGPLARIANAASDRPLLAAALAGVAVVALAVTAWLARHRLREAWRQARVGLAILSPPARYVRLLFLPSLVSHLLGCASTMVLLGAFGIPVTIWTVALALGSNALAGAVRITPGGIGTTQALDVIALRDYAAPDVVTAYSLSELAITALCSAAISVVALVSVHGWRGTGRMVVHLRRGTFGEAMRRRAIRRGQPPHARPSRRR